MEFDANKARNFLSQSDEVVASLVVTSRKLSGLAQYQKVCEHVKLLCQDAFNEFSVDVHLFGSRIIGLASETSDLDIFVDIGERFYSTYVASKDMKLRFEKLVEALQVACNWQVKKLYSDAAIPVMKLIYLPMQLECEHQSFPAKICE